MVEVVAFAGALAHAREHRVAAVRLGDVIDEFLNEHGLAHAGAAEQAHLAALRVRSEQVHDLDAGDQHLDFRRLLDECRGRSVNGAALAGLHRASLVDGLADHVDDAPERLVAHRHGDSQAGVHDFLAAHETFGRVHRDGADRAFAKMLSHFQNKAVALVLRLKRVQNRGKRAVELHVDDSSGYLPYAANSSIAHLSIPQNLSKFPEYGAMAARRPLRPK